VVDEAPGDARSVERSSTVSAIETRPGDEARENNVHMRSHEPPGQFEGSLRAPAGPLRELSFTAESLSGLRHSLSAWASTERLGAERVEELILAVNELATNSVRHGGGGGTLLMWREKDTLLCEVRDPGQIEPSILAGALPPPDASGGRGLWLVHQLCDVVQIRSSSAGTVVRVQARLD
jgi:anti-sigma regulatory factor (Ser/Thr protein kinase)